MIGLCAAECCDAMCARDRSQLGVTKMAVTWGCVRASQQVSSTPDERTKADVGAIQNLVVCDGGITAHGAEAYPASLAHVG
jgi:hypothetical protein